MVVSLGWALLVWWNLYGCRKKKKINKYWANIPVKLHLNPLLYTDFLKKNKCACRKECNKLGFVSSVLET